MKCQIKDCEYPAVLVGPVLAEVILSGLCVDHTNGFKDWLYLHPREMAEHHLAEVRMSRMRTAKFPERFFARSISLQHNDARGRIREIIRKYLLDADKIDLKLQTEAYLNAPTEDR